MLTSRSTGRDALKGLAIHHDAEGFQKHFVAEVETYIHYMYKSADVRDYSDEVWPDGSRYRGR